MKKGFSLVELIISIGLISAIALFSVVLINVKPTYADPYEELRKIISDATYLYLNMNEGQDLKNNLNDNKEIVINSNILINEGLLENEYYVENINRNKNVENLEITVSLDDEGIMNYWINIE